jgi:general secretion pathway protein L
MILRSGLSPVLSRWHGSAFPGFIRWWGTQLLACLPAQWQRWVVSDDEILVYWQEGKLWDKNGRRVVASDIHHQSSVVRLVLILAPEEVLTRSVSLPQTAAHELSTIMVYEVDRYVPFTAHQVYLDFERPVICPDKSLLVNLVVVARVRLDAILQTLSGQGFRITAVAALDSSGRRLQVDLAPPNWHTNETDPRRRARWLLATVCVALMFLAMQLWLMEHEHQLDAMRSDVKALRNQTQDIQALRQRLSAAQEAGQYVVTRKTQAPSISGLLSELSQCIPKGTWLEQLVINSSGDVTLEGQSEQASGLITQMKKCPSLTNPSFSGVIQTDPLTGKDRFSVVTHLKLGGLHYAPAVQTP